MKDENLFQTAKIRKNLLVCRLLGQKNPFWTKYACAKKGHRGFTAWTNDKRL